MSRLRVDPPLLRLATYGLAAVFFAFEAAVGWLLLHPDVPPAYRAYYIDRTTTCLEQPVTGEFLVDEIVPVQPDTSKRLAPIRVCGWEGPAGDGLHAVGTSARLRFAALPADRPLVFVAGLAAISRQGRVQPQRVRVLLNGELAAIWNVESREPQEFSVPLPPSARATGGLELTFAFPDAVQMGRTDPDTRWRSIRLLSVGLLTAPAGAAD